MIEGSCLCGGVRYRYDGEIGEISLCHCSQCRKAHGSAFAAVSPVAAARFRIVAGADLLREYRASPDKKRVFCGTCGSPIYSAKDDVPDVVRLRVGSVDTPFAPTGVFHIFCASKASWDEALDAAPHFAERRP